MLNCKTDLGMFNCRWVAISTHWTILKRVCESMYVSCISFYFFIVLSLLSLILNAYWSYCFLSLVDFYIFMASLQFYFVFDYYESKQLNFYWICIWFDFSLVTRFLIYANWGGFYIIFTLSKQKYVEDPQFGSNLVDSLVNVGQFDTPNYLP